MKRFLWMSLFVWALSPQARCAEDTGSERAVALEKWVETRLQLSKELQDWRVGRKTMEDRIGLLRGETEALKEKTALAVIDVRRSDAQLEEANARKAELKAGAADLGPVIAGLEARVRAQLARSPAPIQERVRPLSQRIPVQPDATKLSLSERFQNIIGILNELGKFAREITVASEVRELPDGTRAEVSVLYLGLGQAYYCNEKGGLAGTGRPGDAGWTWEPDNELVEAVSTAIGVYRNEKPAAYVALPVQIKNRMPDEVAP